MEQNNFDCKSCSKERQDVINVTRFIQKLDDYFSKGDLESAGKHIEYWANEAQALGDTCSLLSILNEDLGFCRRQNEKQRALKTADRIISIIENGGLQNKVSSATLLVNLATTLKHFGFAEKGLPFFEKAQKIYQDYCLDESYEYAALLNNRAASYIDMGEYENADLSYKLALEILNKLDDVQLEIAETYANIAELKARNENADVTEIDELLDKCWEKLNDDNLPRDGKYAFTLTKCAPAFINLGRETEGQVLREIAQEIYDQ